jgi:general secretion pathway protein I
MKFASIGLRAAYRRALFRSARAGGAERNGESGLTLLEVLVALTILAIAMTSLFEAHSTAIKATGTTEDTAQARLIAQAKLAETLADWAGGSRGQSGAEGRFAWRVGIAPEAASWSALKSEGNWRLYRVNVTVDWAGKHRVELNTLKLGVAK